MSTGRVRGPAAITWRPKSARVPSHAGGRSQATTRARPRSAMWQKSFGDSVPEGIVITGAVPGIRRSAFSGVRSASARPVSKQRVQTDPSFTNSFRMLKHRIQDNARLASSSNRQKQQQQQQRLSKDSAELGSLTGRYVAPTVENKRGRRPHSARYNSFATRVSKSNSIGGKWKEPSLISQTQRSSEPGARKKQKEMFSATSAFIGVAARNSGSIHSSSRPHTASSSRPQSTRPRSSGLPIYDRSRILAVDAQGPKSKAKLDYLGNLVSSRVVGPFKGAMERTAVEDVKANSGFESEVMTAVHLVDEFVSRYKNEEIHFDSFHLFVEHKLREALSFSESVHSPFTPNIFRCMVISFLLGEVTARIKATSPRSSFFLWQLLEYLQRALFVRYGHRTSALPSALKVPYFLKNKYLFESTRMMVEKHKHTQIRLQCADTTIAKVHGRADRISVRMQFLAWREWARLQTQRTHMFRFVGLAKGPGARHYGVCFLAWRSYASTRKLHGKFWNDVKETQRVIEAKAQNVLAVQKEASLMGDQLKSVMTEFTGFVNEGTNERVASDLFSSPFGFVVFERCRSQLEMLASALPSNFFDFIVHMAKPGESTPTALIDRISDELDALGFKEEDQGEELTEIRIQLREKLGLLLSKERDLQNRAVEIILHVSAEEVLIEWLHRHLQYVSSPRRLSDLSTDLCDSEIYLDLFKSIARDVYDRLSVLPTSTHVEKAHLVFAIAKEMGCYFNMSLQSYMNVLVPSHEDSEDDEQVVDRTSGPPPERIWLRGDPNAHLCFLATLFLQRPTLPHEDNGRSVRILFERLDKLELQWKSFEAHGLQPANVQNLVLQVEFFCEQLNICTKRVTMERRYFDMLISKAKDVMWEIQGRRLSGIATKYAVKEHTAEFKELSVTKIMDLLSDSTLKPLVLLSQVEKLIGLHMKALRSVFRHYSSVAAGQASIGRKRFLRLLRDSALLPVKLNKSAAETIYRRSTLTLKQVARSKLNNNLQRGPGGKYAKGFGPGDVGDSSTRFGIMGFAEFVEALCRVASQVYYTNKDLRANLEALIVNDMLPRATKLSMNDFENAMKQRLTKNVLTSHSAWLKSTFTHYCQASDRQYEDQDDLKLLHLNTDGFRMIMQQADLEHRISKNAWLSIFSRVVCGNDQEEEGTAEDQDDASAALVLDFAAFQTCLAAVAVYLNSNPYVPVHIKIDQFLSKTLQTSLTKHQQMMY